MMNVLREIVNPWIWWLGPPLDGWRHGLETYWPILTEGALVSVALGLLGCFLVVRGMSLLGDALSHSVLPGIVLGFLAGAWFGQASLHSPWILVGATAIGLAAAMLVRVVKEQSRVKEDASLGIIFTTMFAAGVVMINLFAGQTDLDPGCVLYGDIVNFIIDRDGIWPMAVITVGVMAGIVVFYRQLLVCAFDPGLAVSLGISAQGIEYVMLGVLSLTIVASFEAVGAILAVALLVLPGASARLWSDRMPRVLLLAGAHGVLSTLMGYWASHPSILNTSASGAICVAGFALFLLSWLLAPRHGLLTRLRARRRLARNMSIENLLKAIADAASAKGTGAGAGGGAGGDGAKGEASGAATESAVAADLRVSPAALDHTIRRGVRRGWIRREAGRLSFTPAGLERSRRIGRAHERWEQFLRQEIGLPSDHVHDPAEWIEHYLDDERLDEIDAALAGVPAAGSAAE